MNIIFTIIFIICVTIFAIFNPDGALKAMSDGGQKAITLSIGLISIYTLWSGFLKIAEQSGVTDKLAKFLTPIIDKLFKKTDEQTKKQLSINIGANLLGLGGIATPSGIKATTMLCQKGDHDGACLLFVLSATSLQLLPTTVISLRQNFNSISPSDIFIPSLLTTILSTSAGVFMCFILKNRKPKG
jgi:spore maturation protein A